MNNPCPHVSICECDQNPLSNYSSEAPDVDFFRLPAWAFRPRRLGDEPDDGWDVGAPPTTCDSTVSPEASLLCGLTGGIVTPPGINPPPPPNGPGGPTGPGGNPIIYYYNRAKVCSLPCPDGTFFAYTVAAGVFVDTNQDMADQRAFSYACTQAFIRRTCLSSPTSRACLETVYSDTITASRGGAWTFVITGGMLPPGLTLSGGPAANQASITGTPTTPGSYSFAVQASSVIGVTASKTITISVLGITTASLPNGTDAVAYSEILTASGGTAPYTFALELGSLPDGITLASNGTLSGTPTESGTFPVTFSVTDAASGFCIKDLTLTIDPGACPAAILNVVTGVFGGGYAVACVGTGELAHPNKLYTMDIGFNKIVVMDLDTDAIVGSFATSGGFDPFNFGVAVPSHNRFFYDAHDAGGLTHYVGMQNLTTNAAIAPIGPNANAYEFWKYDPVVDLVFCSVTDFADFSKKKVFSLNPTTGVKSAEITVGTNLDAIWGMCYISTLDKFCTSRVAFGSTFLLETWDRVTGAAGVSLDTGTFFVQQSIYLPGTNRLYVVAQDQVSSAYFLHIYDPLTLALVKSIALHPTDTYDGLCFSAATGLVIISGVDTVAYVNTVSETLLCTYALTTPNSLNATYLNKFYASGEFANNIEEFQ